MSNNNTFEFITLKVAVEISWFFLPAQRARPFVALVYHLFLSKLMSGKYQQGRAGVGLVFGLGSLFLGVLFLLRLLPRFVSLSCWLGSGLLTGGLGFLVLYVLTKSSAL